MTRHIRNLCGAELYRLQLLSLLAWVAVLVPACKDAADVNQTVEVGYFKRAPQPSACSDLCEADRARCTGDVIELCAAGRDGCLVWLPAMDCEGSGLICNDAQEPPRCGPGCGATCDVSGASRCVDNSIERCVLDDQLCMGWAHISDCGTAGRDCVVGEDEQARCIGGCGDECRTVDATRCDGAVVQVCEVQDDGCNDWVVVEDCGADGRVCDRTTSPFSCRRCDAMPCENGRGRCADETAIEYCYVDQTGCTNWTPGGDCANSNRSCDESAGWPNCICSTTCTQDERRCEADTIEVCRFDGTGCPAWFTETDCSSTSQTCDAASGEPSCQ